MKKILLSTLALFILSALHAQSMDPICVALMQLTNAADKHSLASFRGALLEERSKKSQFNVKYYESTIKIPGFTQTEIFDISNNGHQTFQTQLELENEEQAKSKVAVMRKQISDCLKATKQKFQLNDNGEKYDLWWQYKQAKIVLHHYKNYRNGKQIFRLEIYNMNL